MNHLPHNLTETQIQNYRELADYLNTGITEYGFHMNTYKDEFECGTVACAIGHAPFVLGIENPFKIEVGEDYYIEKCNKFSVEYFGVNVFNQVPTHVYVWCFAGSWWRADNTARGAAARIYYMLENGIPENYGLQSCNRATLSYTVKPLPEIEPATEKEKEIA